jgi:WD40 repeat protein
VPTRRLAFSPDGSQLAFIGDSGAIVLWDLNAMRGMTTLAVEPHPPGTAPVATALAYSRDGTMLAAADSDRDLLVWDTRDYTAPARRLPLDNQLDPINAIAFRDDGVLASASDDRTVDLAYVPPAPQPFTGDSLSPAAAGHLVPVETVGFSADGQLLASGDTDGETRLWSVRPTGAAGSANAAPTLTTPRSLAVLSGPTQAVISVAFSGDDSLLASSSEDRTVTLWRLTGAHDAVATLSGLPAPSSAALTPDTGTPYLVTSDDGGTATFWSTDPKAVARQICTDHGPLTNDQWDRYIPDEPYLNGCARLLGSPAATAHAKALAAPRGETAESGLASLSLDALPRTSPRRRHPKRQPAASVDSGAGTAGNCGSRIKSVNPRITSAFSPALASMSL